MFNRHTSFKQLLNKDPKQKELKVLFVSKRDTCRGPMAECIFEHIAEKFSFKPFARFTWRVQSAGLKQYNPGRLPDQLAMRVLAENGLETMHGSRQLRVFDFSRYDYIICMEPTQLEDLVCMAPEGKKARLYNLADFNKGRDKVIHDPYGDDLNAFRICFERLYVACEDFYFRINEKRV